MRIISKEFVPYTESLDLKDLGINNEQITCFGNFINEKLCLGFFHSTHCTPDTILGVTYGQAFEFMREKYHLHSTITSISQESWQWHIQKPGQQLGHLYDEDYDSHEEAEFECLKKLIEIVKEKK